MALHTSWVPLILSKRDLYFIHEFHADLLLVSQRNPANVLLLCAKRSHLTARARSATSTAQTVEVQKKWVPQKGMMDYVLTPADTVFLREVCTDSEGCKLGSSKLYVAYELWSCVLHCGDDARINATL